MLLLNRIRWTGVLPVAGTVVLAAVWGRHLSLLADLPLFVLLLGLGPTEMVLLALTVVVGVLTVVPGRATLLQGAVHLVLFSAFVLLAVAP